MNESSYLYRHAEVMLMPAISKRNVVRAPIAQSLKYGLCSLCINISFAYKRSKKVIVQNLKKTKQNNKKQSLTKTNKTKQNGHAVQSMLSDSQDTLLVSVCKSCPTLSHRLGKTFHCQAQGSTQGCLCLYH